MERSTSSTCNSPSHQRFPRLLSALSAVVHNVQWRDDARAATRVAILRVVAIRRPGPTRPIGAVAGGRRRDERRTARRGTRDAEDELEEARSLRRLQPAAPLPGSRAEADQVVPASLCPGSADPFGLDGTELENLRTTPPGVPYVIQRARDPRTDMTLPRRSICTSRKGAVAREPRHFRRRRHSRRAARRFESRAGSFLES